MDNIGLSFDPVSGLLYAVAYEVPTASNRVIEIDPATGVGTEIDGKSSVILASSEVADQSPISLNGAPSGLGLTAFELVVAGIAFAFWVGGSV
jgi:hypothetical protein